jgi:hypothetical protein
MTTQFDELSKSLAAGMSRRKAARSFLAGLGGVAFAAFTGKSAFADNSAACSTWCSSQAAKFLDMCLTASASCPEGMCASILPTAPVVAPVQINGVQMNGSGLGGPTGGLTLGLTGVTLNGGAVTLNGSTLTRTAPVPQYCVIVGLISTATGVSSAS